MKKYKVFILLGLLTLGTASCDTADLERDIEALKERVENYELQMQKLNDDMNIIRVMLDGNKTITEYSFDGTSYTIKLSNGEVLTLTPGVVGGNYPAITIGENGNWFIGGNDTGIRAKAEDGEDAAYTPQFKIENDNWWVSYDGGKNWTDLGVSAKGEPVGESPIKDVQVTDNEFKLTIGGQEYIIPIVEDLTCELLLPAGLGEHQPWFIAKGQTAEIKVKVNLKSGDLVRAIVPADWKVEISDYSALTGENELTVKVTAPAVSSKCLVSVEVTRGVNTAADEIVAHTVSDNYYADYLAGMDVRIGDVTINKFTHPDAIYVDDEATQIITNGVYFIKEGLELTLKKIRVEDYLFVIGENPQNPSVLNMGNGIFFALNSDRPDALGLVCKNLIIDGRKNMNYLSNIEGDADKNILYKYYLMDQVTFLLNVDKTVFNPAHVNSRVENVIFQSCRFVFSDGTASGKILNIGSKAAAPWDQTRVVMRNNVFQSSAENQSVGIVLYSYGKQGNFLLERNTFAGVYPVATQGYLQTSPNDGSIFGKNIIYTNVLPYKGSYTNGANIVSSSAKPAVSPGAVGNYTDNIVYENAAMVWKLFRNNAPSGVDNIIKTKTGSPFVAADFATGKFVLTDEYKGKYGAE